MLFKRYMTVCTASLLLAMTAEAQTPKNVTLDSLQKQINDLQQQLDEAAERTDEIELEATLNKVKFGLETSTSISNFNVSPSNIKTDRYHNNGKFATEVHLNMSANVNERTKFTGRLSVAKGWGEMGWGSLPAELEAGRSLGSGPIVYLDRAYVDYILYDGLIATLGRQPGTDGPGSNLRNNSARLATYPASFVNTLGDALVLTYAPKYFGESEFTFRVGYSKIYQWVEGSGSSNHFTGNQKDADADLYFVETEGKLPLGPVGDNLAILSFLHIANYTLPINTATLPLGPVNLGDMQVLNFYFENNKAFGLPLNWFVSAGYNKSTADNGDDIVYKVTNGAIATKEQLNSLIAASGQNISPSLLQANAVTEMLKLNKDAGYSIHVGARYDLPFNFKLGYEFFHGSKYWYAISRPNIHDPLDFRNTRGNVHDVYMIYQMDFNQYLRASYTNLHNKYSNYGLPFGGAIPVDRTAEIFMLMYNLKF